MNHILQQDIPKQNIIRVLETTGPSGSYMFSGPEGVGKKLMALFFAGAANCTDPPTGGGFCGKCQSCLAARKTYVDHPDVVLFSSSDSPFVIDRQTLFRDLGIQDAEQYFEACDYLYETGFLTHQLRRFSAGRPVDFIYRDPVTIDSGSKKVLETYNRLVESKKQKPHEGIAARLLHDLFMRHTRGCFKDSIKLKDIHSIITHNAEMAPLVLRYKFYILDDAHLMTDEAQNAILKILEEPPKHTIFILVSSLPQNLFPTILSRTTKLYFQPLSREIIADEMVHRRGESPDRARIIAAYSKGCLSLALQTDSDVFFRERERVILALTALFSDKNYSWSNAAQLFTGNSGIQDGQQRIPINGRLELLSSVVQDMIWTTTGLVSRRVHSDIDEDTFASLSSELSRDQWVEVASWLGETVQSISLNQDVLLNIENLFIKINDIGKLNRKETD